MKYEKKIRLKMIKEKRMILALSSNMITYLDRKFIRKSLQNLAEYSKYVLFYNCSQYEKELCVASIFRTFPYHIYLSNYSCDNTVFQRSNLSVC